MLYYLIKALILGNVFFCTTKTLLVLKVKANSILPLK